MSPLHRRPLLGVMVLTALVGWGMGLLAREDRPAPPPALGPRLDVAFVVDATGSMADEIDVVKRHLAAMMARIRSGQPAPRVRFGLVAYRDYGDEFVTRVWGLNDRADELEAALRGLSADGGGDTPEAVAEALHAAVLELAWDPDPATGRLVFLVGDAAPHQEAGADVRAEVQAARARGLKVHALGCSGIQDSGEAEFREVAGQGGGTFEFLTYHQEVVREDGSAAHVLYQGGRVYEASDAGADWKGGAARMAEKGEARALPGAAPAPARAAGLENNLERVLTEAVMDEARSKGTRY